MSSLPMYFPPGYDKGDAKTCAGLVNTAYKQVAQWIAQDYPGSGAFVWQTPDDGYTYSAPLYWTYDWPDDWGVDTTYNEPIGFVATDASGTAYLVFRGTITDADDLYDTYLDQVSYGLAQHYGFVHSGFYDIYASLSDQVRATLGSMNGAQPFKRLVFTGHSLGCGLSTLAVPDVITNAGLHPSALPMIHYNFASPRVGDPVFAGMMDGNGIPTFRVVNTEDIVPDIPPSVSGDIIYKHIGTPVDFTAQYGSVDDNHSLTHAYIYALDNPGNPEDMLAGRAPPTVRIAAGAKLRRTVPPWA